MLEINHYHNKDHHSQVLEKVDNDEQIEKLYNQMTKVIDVNRTVKYNVDIPHEQRRTENEKTRSISARIA